MSTAIFSQDLLELGPHRGLYDLCGTVAVRHALGQPNSTGLMAQSMVACGRLPFAIVPVWQKAEVFMGKSPRLKPSALGGAGWN